MKVLLVCPRFPDSLWSFAGINAIAGVKSAQAPLGLATVAALTPPDWEVEVVDENVRSIDFDTPADVVGLSIFNVQHARALEIAKEFRRRGRWIVAGGPYPTLCPEHGRGHFDTVFQGEAEETWPTFCREFAAGVRKPLYEQIDKVDLTRSPVPRLDRLDVDRYLYFYIQTTRGCPFTCEFCDIIITDGRRPRAKTIPQVMAEVEAVRAVGGTYVSFSDANLIGDPRHAKALLTALRDWGRRHRFPIKFSGELTINCADMPDVLDLLQAANFDSVFLGIESPRIESLHAASKRVNTRGRSTLLEKIRRIQSRNLVILAGMIVGFDTDDHAIFEEQYRFLLEAGIPFTTSGILFAIEHTPLHARLRAEGRLFDVDYDSIQVHGAADLNFVPKLMTVAELKAGYNWMIRQHYKYDNYRTRLVEAVRHFTKSDDPAIRSASRVDRTQLWRGLRIVAHYLLGPRRKRDFFLGTLRDVARTGFTRQKLIVSLGFLLLHKHFHEFVERVHGDPETVGPTIVWPGREASDAEDAGEGVGRAVKL
jgi:radical SAM superfamily enzyme YgiQ (UPF0313 family)